MKMIDSADYMIPGPSGRISVRCKAFNNFSENVVVLVQGANISGVAGYDLSFDGGEHYSFMDALADRGIASVTFSIRGYAESELDGDPLTVQTDQAIEDLAAVIDWLNTEGVSKPHLLGWSWGGRIVGRYAEVYPNRLDRLVLLDPALGGGQLILPAPTEGWWDNTYEYFMDRLEDEFTDLPAKEALARYVSQNEPKSPNGIRQENAEGSVPADPTKIINPTLMIYGSAAGGQNYMKGSSPRTEFYEALGTEDKALVVIPGGGDYAHIQNPRRRVHKAIAEFLN